MFKCIHLHLKSHGLAMNIFLFKRFRLYTYCICLSSLAELGLRQPSHADISSAPAHPLDLASTVFKWVRGTNFTCQAVRTATSCLDTPQMSKPKHLTARVAIKRCAVTDVLVEVTRGCQFLREIGRWMSVQKKLDIKSSV